MVTTSSAIKVVKSGHLKRSPENREYADLTLENVTNYNDVTTGVVSTSKRNILPQVIQCLKTRFSSFTEQEVFKHMLWADPANWFDNISGELESMLFLANPFEKTLQQSNFDPTKLKTEWRNLKLTAKNLYRGVDAKTLWRQILTYRRQQFLNVCLLVRSFCRWE